MVWSCEYPAIYQWARRKHPSGTCDQFQLTIRLKKEKEKEEDRCSTMDLLDTEKYEKLGKYSSGGRCNPFSIFTFNSDFFKGEIFLLFCTPSSHIFKVGAFLSSGFDYRCKECQNSGREKSFENQKTPTILDSWESVLILKNRGKILTSYLTFQHLATLFIRLFPPYISSNII